ASRSASRSNARAEDSRATLRHPDAAIAVSSSANKSSAMARAPARRAATARGRAESATASAGCASADKLERHAIGIAKIEALGFLRLVKALQQRMLQLEFHVADRQSADADAGRP